MNKVYTSAVVIIPPDELWTPIQNIRRKYDRNIHRWMPHITLLYPFRPESDYNKLESSFWELCTSIEPFVLKLKNIKFFAHGNQKFTIWLKPEPEDLIVNFQSKLLTLVPDCNDVNQFKNGFMPHLSLVQIKGKKRLYDVLESLQEYWIEIQFLLQEIFFIARTQDKSSRFEIKKRIPFLNRENF